MTDEQKVREGFLKWWNEDQGRRMSVLDPRCLEAWQAALAWNGTVKESLTVGSREEPDIALLASMATCLHHGFGLLDAAQQETMLANMRKLWDEVMGYGFYRPSQRTRYLSMVAAAPQPTEGERAAVPDEGT